MKYLLTFVIAAGALALLAGPAPAQSVQPPSGFTAIFNGRDLDGWYGWAIHENNDKDANPKIMAGLSVGERAKKIGVWTDDAKKHWSVQNGELVNDGHGAYLATVKDYGDIELLIEYKTVPKADSGIYLRATPQVQIWDASVRPGSSGQDKGSGGLWNNSRGAPGKDPAVLADKPFGQWNKFRIIQVGERTTVYLNDKLVVNHARMENYWEKQDRKNPLFRTGPILLQTHGGEIRWRNIFVREIPPTEANDILLKHGNEGFKAVFNGRDLEGWTGPLDNYEVKDGAIVCKPKKGGVLHTKEQFSDFVARVEFKLPPAGNNGLAIRYPGDPTGRTDTSYHGMCEIQILDDPHQQYAKIDPRQACGSVYGMVAAKRGYLRPVGEWNFYEVTVKGPTIKVELNGTVIVDADVTKVTEFMGNRPHPGKDRPSGHFGFAGHSDPVAFRTVRIKPLN